MAHPEQGDQVLILAAGNRMSGPSDVTIVWMAAVISDVWTCAHVMVYLNIAIGVSMVAPWRQRCTTWQRIYATGHLMGWYVHL